jgi:hypothetical protein
MGKSNKTTADFNISFSSLTPRCLVIITLEIIENVAMDKFEKKCIRVMKPLKESLEVDVGLPRDIGKSSDETDLPQRLGVVKLETGMPIVWLCQENHCLLSGLCRGRHS